jgi:hypothetical protein
LKALLIIQTIGLVGYTVIAMQHDGINFLARAQQFVTSMTWMGQFTLDFQCYLILSALWIAWRNRFSAYSMLIAIVAMVLGIIVFAPYVLYLLSKHEGDLKRVLLGVRIQPNLNP